MATFTYTTTVKGKEVKGEIDAEDEKQALAQLKSKNIKVDKVKKKSAPLFGGGGQKKITGRDLVIFTRQFSTMVDAGLPLVTCLDILGKQAENPTLGEVTLRVKTNIEVGGNLSDSLRKHPKVFDGLYCNMVEAGEAGGILETILQRLSVYIEKAESLKKKIKGAMVYPSVIVSVAIGVVSLLMVFVIPSIATMFESSGAELPGPTKNVLMISNFFRYKWYYLFGGIGGFIYLIIKIYNTEKGRIELDRLSLKLPVVGNLVRKVSVAKFTRTLGTLISSGVPLIEALDICARTSGNKIIEFAIINTIAAIKEGETIAAPLARENVFPPMVISMIDVGESSGALDAMLGKIADFYDEEVDTAVAALTAMLEPMLMVFLGISIGYIVIAMFLPIFKMGETV